MPNGIGSSVLRLKENRLCNFAFVKFPPTLQFKVQLKHTVQDSVHQ